MHSKVVIVTPELAKEWLAKNIDNNRRVSAESVSNYAEAMKNGNWQLTPDGISFNQNGKLVNGQHRLLAVVKANVPVKMNVTFEVPNSTYMFDRGNLRTTANVLQMSGTDAGRSDVSFANFAIALARGTYLRKKNPDSLIKLFLDRELWSIKEAESVLRAGSSGGRKAVTYNSPCQLAAWTYLKNGMVGEGVLRKFFKTANTGIYGDNNGEVCAVHFRNVLLENPRFTSRGEKDRTLVFKMCAKAIYDYANGKNRKIAYKTSDYINFDPFKGTIAEEIVKKCIRDDEERAIATDDYSLDDFVRRIV